MARHHHEGVLPKFVCLGSNSSGTTTCQNCYQEVGLDEAFNEYFYLLEKAVEKDFDKEKQGG